MKNKDSLFSTSRFLVSVLYQNHLDTVQGAFEAFCKTNKGYHWGITAYSPKAKKLKDYPSDESDLENSLPEAELESIKYYVKKSNSKSALIFSIDDGISISIKHGTYELYGLYGLLCELGNSLSSPQVFVTLRKYWLVSLFLSALIIPSSILWFFNLGWWILAWIIAWALLVGITLSILLDSNEWDDYILKTDIKYNEYGTKTINIFQSAFGSIRVAISVLASLATILTFIIFWISSR